MGESRVLERRERNSLSSSSVVRLVPSAVVAFVCISYGLVTIFSTPFRKCVFHARTDRRTKIENLIEFLENFSSTTKKGEKKLRLFFVRCYLLLFSFSVRIFLLSVRQFFAILPAVLMLLFK